MIASPTRATDGTCQQSTQGSKAIAGDEPVGHELLQSLLHLQRQESGGGFELAREERASGGQELQQALRGSTQTGLAVGLGGRCVQLRIQVLTREECEWGRA